MKPRRGWPLRVLVWVDSTVVSGFVQCRCCLVLLWRRRGYEFVFCGGLCQIVSFFYLVLLCFFSVYVYWCLFLFCFVEMKMDGGFVRALRFGLKILNLVFRIEDMGSLVLALFCWLHMSIQHDFVLSWCCSKGIGA